MKDSSGDRSLDRKRHKTGVLKSLYQNTIGFVLHQTRNFKIMLIRRPVQGISMNLSGQYNSIYATALGANPLQLGSLQSVGNAVGAAVSLPAGWLIDHYSLKNVFLFGTVMMALASALYLGAQHWSCLYAAIILLMIGMRITCTACTVTCANELTNKERATGRGFCRTFSSVTLLVTPIIAAWIISVSGGLNIEGIRPLYALQLAIYGFIFFLLTVLFRDTSPSSDVKSVRNVLRDFFDVLKQGPDVIRMMFMIALVDVPFVMAQPFMPLYAHQFKGADEFVLGGIAAARTLSPLVLSIPLGKLADRYGRKRMLLALAPMLYAANLCLIWAPNPGILLLFGFFFGFNGISVALAAAMAAEIMPKEQMGRWIGIVSLVRGVVSIPAPIIGGFIWDHIGPRYVFVAVILIDIAVRLPLLLSIKETLRLESDS
jgi:MFS family permease